MRITFLVGDVDAGGLAERSVLAQASALAGLGQQVGVVSVLGRAKDAALAVDRRVEVRRLVDVRTPRRPRVADPALLPEDRASRLHAEPSRLVPRRWDRRWSALTDAVLEQELPALAADVVVTTSPALLAVAVQLLPSGSGGPAVVHRQDGAPEGHSGSAGALLASAARADLVAVADDLTQDRLRVVLGAAAPPSVVVPDPLPPGFRPSSTLETGLVVAAARLAPESQLPSLVAAFAQVADAAPGWRLRLLGSGPQREELVRAVRRRRLHDRLELPGDSADLRSEWAMASICAVTSRADGPALDAQEAMAAGVPVVAYDVPTAPRAIVRHDVDGLLVSPGSVPGLAAALAHLMQDADARHRLGRGALQAAAAWRPEMVGPQLLEVCADAVDRRRAGGSRVVVPARRAGRPAGGAAGRAAGGAAGRAAPAGSAGRPTEHRAEGRAVAAGVTPAAARALALGWATTCARAASTRWFVMPPHAGRPAVVCVPMADRAAFLEALGGPGAPPLLSLVDTAGHGWPEVRDTVPALAARLAAYRTGRVSLEPWPTLPDGTASVLSVGCRVDVEFWERAPDGDLVAGERNPWTDRLAADPGGAAAFVDVEVEGVPVRTLPLMAEPTVLDCRFPIDVVATWVDGDDPVWRASRARRVAGGGGPVGQADTGGRWTSRDELRYSLRSVHLFAPWVRTIHLVTAGQVPRWLRPHPQLRVVDHREILPPDALPTFNSHAIETALHRIPGLAEHFVYLNDDVLLGRPQTPERFFTGAGQPAVFLAERPVGPDPWSPAGGDERAVGVDGDPGAVAAGPWRSAAWNNRRLLRETFGVVNTLNLAHSPHPHRVSVLAEIERRFPEEIGRTARSPFRSTGDVSLLSSLAQHYGLATGAAVVGSAASALVDLRAGNLERRLHQLLARRHDFICLADSAGLALTPQALRELVDDWGSAYVPVPAPWEAG